MIGKTYYVYYLIDSSNDKVFYIGKGKDKRMYVHEQAVRKNRKAYSPNKHLYNKIAKLLEEKIKIKYQKVFETDDENLAYEVEEEHIANIGLENLCNVMINRRPPSYAGYKSTEETKQKLRNNAKNNPNSGMKGKKHTEESKRKMAIGNSGINNPNYGGLSEEHKRKIGKANSIANKGKKHTEETKQKMSRTRKGRKLGTLEEKHGKERADKIKNNLSESHKGTLEERFGKEKADEIKNNLSESQKGNIPWNKGKKMQPRSKTHIANQLLSRYGIEKYKEYCLKNNLEL